MKKKQFHQRHHHYDVDDEQINTHQPFVIKEENESSFSDSKHSSTSSRFEREDTPNKTVIEIQEIDTTPRGLRIPSMKIIIEETSPRQEGFQHSRNDLPNQTKINFLNLPGKPNLQIHQSQTTVKEQKSTKVRQTQFQRRQTNSMFVKDHVQLEKVDELSNSSFNRSNSLHQNDDSLDKYDEIQKTHQPQSNMLKKIVLFQDFVQQDGNILHQPEATPIVGNGQEEDFEFVSDHDFSRVEGNNSIFRRNSSGLGEDFNSSQRQLILGEVGVKEFDEFQQDPENNEMVEEKGPYDPMKDFVLISKSKEIAFSIKHILKKGNKETQMLKSAIVLNVHGTPKAYARNSLYLFEADNWFRMKVIWFVEWKYFEYFILLVIFVNSITLTLFDYKDRESRTSNNKLLDRINVFFTGIYTCEAILKIIAYGFVKDRRSYLRETWNIIDFVVAFTGIIEMSVSSNSRELRTLRTIRVLRPLKSVNSMPGIKKHVETLVNALPNFLNVSIFLIFIFVLLSILGLHQYGESLLNRCRYSELPEIPGVSWTIVADDIRPCTITGFGRHKCAANQFCGNPFHHGIPIENDGVGDNAQIFYGITTFNNIFSSLLLINQFISTDGWSQFMYNLMDVDHPVFAVIYSLVIIVIGTFFIMNLILAVIIDTFVNIQEKERKRQLIQVIPEIVVSDDEFYPEKAIIGRQNSIITATIGKMRGQFSNESDLLNTSQSKDQDRVKQRNKHSQFSDCQKSTPPLEFEKYQTAYFDQNEIQPIADFKVNSSQKQKKKVTMELPNLQLMPSESPHRIISGEISLIHNKSQKKQVRIMEQISNEDQDASNNDESYTDEYSDSIIDSSSEEDSSKTKKLKMVESIKKRLAQEIAKQTKIALKQERDALKNQDNRNSSEEDSRSSESQIIEEPKEISMKQVDIDKPLAILAEFNTIKIPMLNNSMLAKLTKIRGSERKLADVIALKYQILERADKSKLYAYCYIIVNNEYFSIIISWSIVINTLVQSFDQYPETWYLERLDQVSSFFSVVFITELFLKLIALGFKFYFRDPFNTFDCIIVFTSFIDITVSNIFADINVNAITALRTFRLLRIFKLARTWKQFYQLLKTMWKTLVDIATFSIVLFLFMFIYSILGMEVFAEKAKFDANNNVDLKHGESMPQNFDSFLWSFTTVFVLLTEDAWSAVFQNYSRACGSFRANLYFLSLFIIGPRILLNLFLAILLQNFDDDSLELEESNKNDDQEPFDLESLTQIELLWYHTSNYLKGCLSKKKSNKVGALGASTNSLALSEAKYGVNSRMASMRLKKLDTSNKNIDDLYLYGKSLNYFDIESPLREKLFNIIMSKQFEQFIIVFIMLSSIQLALTNPLNDPNGKMQRALYWVDFFTTIVFLIECCSKIVTFGFVNNGPPSYLKNPWNLLDFIIIILSVVSISPIANKLQVFKMFRILRALRLISRAEGLRIGLQAIVQAIPNVLRIVMIMVIFFIIFGIIAISYFKGRFFYCSQDMVVLTIPDVNKIFVIDYKWDCINTGGEWVKLYYNFDNMYQAMASLFIMSNVAGWADFMYIGAQVTEIDQVWRKWKHQYWVFFFIGFMVMGSFFLLNLFVGVVISSFNRQKDHLGGTTLLSERQREWVDTHLTVLKCQPMPRPPKPTTDFGKFCLKLYQSNRFENFIYICIVLNTFILTLKWAGQSKNSMLTIDVINYIFSAIFICEAIIKITAMGELYFYDKWNIFDFMIVMTSLLTISLDYLSSISLGNSTTVVRAFRISKILRLIKKSKSLRHIFKTFIVSLKPLANIGSLLILILYMYAIAGVILFGQVKRNGILNDSLNFEGFTAATLALFVIATTDAWTDIGRACLKNRSVDFDCIPFPTYKDYVANGRQTIGCGPQFSGVLFFYSYFLIMSLILLKLFIAIILEAYDDIKRKDRQLFNEDILETFNETWTLFENETSGFIKIYQLRGFLKKLGNPLGFTEQLKNGSRQEQDIFISSLNLPTYNDFTDYHYTDILDALALRLTIYDYVHRKRELEKEKELNGGESSSSNHESSILTNSDTTKHKEDDKPLTTEEDCLKTRQQLLNEINVLILGEKAQDILVLKEIQKMVEIVSQARKDKDIQDLNITSKHHIYALRAGQRMKRFLYRQRKNKQRKTIGEFTNETLGEEESDHSYHSAISVARNSRTKYDESINHSPNNDHQYSEESQQQSSPTMSAKMNLQHRLGRAITKIGESPAKTKPNEVINSALENLLLLGNKLIDQHSKAVQMQQSRDQEKDINRVHLFSSMKSQTTKMLDYYKSIKSPQDIAEDHRKSLPIYSRCYRMTNSNLQDTELIQNNETASNELYSARNSRRSRLRSAVTRKEDPLDATKSIQQKRQRPYTAFKRQEDTGDQDQIEQREIEIEIDDEEPQIHGGTGSVRSHSVGQERCRSNLLLGFPLRDGEEGLICMHQNLFQNQKDTINYSESNNDNAAEQINTMQWKVVTEPVKNFKTATFSISRK